MVDLVPATSRDPARIGDARRDFVDRIRGAHAKAQPPRPAGGVSDSGNGSGGEHSPHGRHTDPADSDRASRTGTTSPRQGEDGPPRSKGKGTKKTEVKKRARNQEPRYRKNAAVGMALPDLVDALEPAPETAKAVKALGELIEHDLQPEFEKEALKAGLEPAEVARTHHLWCELTTAAADALAAARNNVRQAENSVAEWITLPLRRAEVPPPLHGLATATAVSMLRSFRATGVDPTEWVTALRILAVAICPQPHQHPELVRRALLPLRRLVTGEVMAEIRAEFGMNGYKNGEPPPS